jgi:hypothetical protein
VPGDGLASDAELGEASPGGGRHSATVRGFVGVLGPDRTLCDDCIAGRRVVHNLGGSGVLAETQIKVEILYRGFGCIGAALSKKIGVFQ